MQFTTPVELGKQSLNIGHRSNILLLGSCFAQNIGKRLLDCKFNICCNPFGIIYNPLSIATVLQRIISGEPFDEQSPELVECNEKWHSILHHGDFSRRTKSEIVGAINHSLQQAHKQIQQADIVTITFGTAYAYERRSDGLVVSNCHKLTASTFRRRLLSIEEITDRMSEAVRSIKELRPNVRFLFTVSPIRHLRDGAYDNQLSKATLLLSVEKLRTLFPEDIIYFPAYEIMMDELRDYRFYAEDMTHPSYVAIEYIWQKFSGLHLTSESLSLNRAIEEIERGVAHRPFDAGSNAYKNFISNIVEKIEKIKGNHPYLDFEKEIKLCNTLLNR
ncbi:MAG: GSCFA domain-containing protein [Bacteroidaceae bacterium]|nr:GSCFA domain-containing protein [Bacteroidaceae bacterium]